MKKMIIVFATIFCMLMVGCGSNSINGSSQETQVVDAITKEEKEEFISDFLIEFFTFNCNNRYDNFMQAMENDESDVDVNGDMEGLQPLPESQQKAYDNYYSDLSKYVTEDCIDTMQANRLPAQLDKFVKEKGIEESVDYIELVAEDEDTYSYKVYFQAEGDTEAFFTEPLAGQVSIETMDGQIKVRSITVVQ